MTATRYGTSAGVLVIDDEPVLRMTIKHFLEEEGYRVWVAANGREGVEIFKKVRPDVVITDMVMPELDGLATIDLLRKEKPGLPIIAMSAFVDHTEIDAPFEDGTFCSLTKPVDQQLLTDLIQAILVPAPDGDGPAGIDGNGRAPG